MAERNAEVLPTDGSSSASASISATSSSMRTISSATASTSLRGSKASPSRAASAFRRACRSGPRQSRYRVRGSWASRGQEHRPAGARLPGREPRKTCARPPGRRRHSTLPDKPSIAVLPFQNMSAIPSRNISPTAWSRKSPPRSSRIRWLFVIARNSAFTYKGRPVDVKQVARELGVRYVLEGSRAQGRKSGADHRPVDRRRDRHSHLGGPLRGDLTDIFALQDKVDQIVRLSSPASVRRKSNAPGRSRQQA